MNDYKELVAELEELSSLNDENLQSLIIENNDLQNALVDAADVIEQLVRERDAAVAAVAEHPYCYNCKHRDKSSKEHPCIICNQIWPNASECKWQWRGLEGKHE